MKKSIYQFEFEEFDTIDELNSSDKSLLLAAREVTKIAYAPYSEFLVGAAAMLNNGEVVKGTNQENASYPIGLCAERVLLAAASSIAPGQSIMTIAITYESDFVDASAPVAPCGICRQSLLEFESRFDHPMRVLLAGSHQIYEFESASLLLPLGFKPQHLGK
mgnify:CR=1 FL=1